ncbi:MAG: penicillin-binding protein 2 [Candidatus Eisenbacteria bacterium]|uniref:Penicillin-binding protein 2 n=1 Tax=Eiseniibacteriota bacterium TaxID=2212470 RepID=A0A9D6LBK0_UNCEI|nr:penicillin-binding protein 2 [Candidatus Eisenbacteria bacterium]MBI3539669.1 penicillin-binding protein 2 [Candidatus Eisenbacteria bacterium]
MRSGSPVRRDRDQRFGVVAAIVLGGFALVVLGLLRLQVAQHEHYRQLSEENRVRLEVIRAPRGTITDRNGVLLADSYPSFNIVFRPMPAESTMRARAVVRPGWVRRVAALVEADTDQVRALVRTANRSGQSAVLRRNASSQVLAGVEENRGELPGIEVVIEPLRRYPHGALAAHLLGYAGEINDQELEDLSDDGYSAGDLIGRTGVERSCEDILRGEDGAEFVVVNAMGKRVATLTEVPPRPPVPGRDLALTVDMHVQQALEDAMAGVEKGAAVAIDPRDGGVLGMVSRPDFDPNEFAHGLSRDRWKELSNGDSNPLLNRAIQGIYPPGSTFKIVTMISALKAGIATPHTLLQPCYGSYQFGGRRFGCWKRDGHGALDFVAALQHSCDVYFYQIGTRLDLGVLGATARAFGLGARTGIDLPQESAGLVPSTAWYDRRWGAGRWRKGVMLNLAIGQGEILCTPLQLALLAAEAATGGQALRPHVVKRVGGEPAPGRPHPEQPGVSASPEAWDAVHLGLERVVDSGTGTAARVPGLAVAGKTGTAQNPHGKDHALFLCYAPADRPTIAMAFVIENTGHGGTFAAPLAGRVLRKLFLPDSLAKVAVRTKPVREDTTGVDHGD